MKRKHSYINDKIDININILIKMYILEKPLPWRIRNGLLMNVGENSSL